MVPTTWMSEYNRGSKNNAASNHQSKQKPPRSARKANELVFCAKLKEGDEETSGEQVGNGQLMDLLWRIQKTGKPPGLRELIIPERSPLIPKYFKASWHH